MLELLPFVLHSVVLMVLVSNALKDGASVILMSLSLPLSLSHHKGELQRSCSRTVAEKVSQQCQLACQCRRYPPLPPPPPPPPPPRLLGTTGKSPSECSPGITPVSLLLSLTVSLSVCSHPAFKAHPKPDAGVNWLVWKK